MLSWATHGQLLNNGGHQKTIITGKVSNFEKYDDHDIIECIYLDILADQVVINSDIDKSGIFRFEVDFEYPTEFYLKYNKLLTLYAYPGDSIFIDIDGKIWDVPEGNYAEMVQSFRPSGSSEVLNKELMKYDLFCSNKMAEFIFQDSMVRACNPDEYMIFLENRYKEKLKKVEAFNNEHNTSSEFREWVYNELLFSKWDDSFRYRWLHPMYTKKDRNLFVASLPKDYYGFLSNWEKGNKDYLKSRAYIHFLREYYMHTMEMMPKDTIEYRVTLFKKDPAEATSVELRYIDRVENGFMKDVLIAKKIYMLLNSKYYDSIKNIWRPGLISDSYLRKRIQEKFNQEKELTEHPVFAVESKLNSRSDEEDILRQIVSKHKDKVIYIDFWAPWCGPCMAEMPPMVEIKKKLMDKDVVFVYLANRCSESSWKNTIAQRKIEGDHYLLTEKQYAVLSGRFGFSGIPHYMLIDKKGILVNKNAPRPSQSEELIEQIEFSLK